MADLYNTVKKQGEQIDDLQKNVTNHNTRIENLETKSMAIPPPAQPILPKEIKVELPPDIATNTSIRRMLAEIPTKSSDREFLKKVVEYLPDATAKAVGKAVVANVNIEVKATLKDGIREELAEERKEFINIVSDLRYRVQSLVNGQWWLSIPKWVYAIFVTLLLASIGFGYGFFHQMEANTKLKEVEWMYRYQRTAYKNENDRQLLMNMEKDFITGATHEKDSIKQLIRYWERERDLDKTFLYFNPTED